MPRGRRLAGGGGVSGPSTVRLRGDGDRGGDGVKGVSWPGGQWNTAWENEIEAAGGYGAMTADKIYEIRDKLVEWFDLAQYRPR